MGRLSPCSMQNKDKISFSLIRSVLITDPLIILATAGFGAVNLVVSFFEKDGRIQLKIARSWARTLCRIAGIRLTIEGLEKIDPNKSYVFASNHLSYFDTPVVLGHIPANFRFLAKEGLFKIPLLGDHLTRAGHIPVPRNDPRAAIRGMNEAARYIRERGVSVLIFPEGGRSLEGLLPFKEGAAYIAIKSGEPVVPVGLIGTDHILPMHSMNVRSGNVVMRIGEPISTKEIPISARGNLTEMIYHRVAALTDQNSTHDHAVV
jgi:1-acyl-sn-glycerol-3-phosphate acyltransferase